MEKKLYILPKLAFGYKDLEPYISEEQLKIHHQKHHQAYVKNANDIFEKIENARREGTELDIKSVLKSLSFNVGGHILHSLFWENMRPGKKDNKPGGAVGKVIEEEFGSFEQFKKEFSKAAVSAEGSGWAALALDQETKRPIIMQIEKHNANIFPGLKIILALDVWEHAYYLDYKNDRAKFVDVFWSIVNWDEAQKRFESAQ